MENPLDAQLIIPRTDRSIPHTTAGSSYPSPAYCTQVISSNEQGNELPIILNVHINVVLLHPGNDLQSLLRHVSAVQ